MSKYQGTSLKPAADSLVINAVRNVLASDFSDATGQDDLQDRLRQKGYAIRQGFLATFPQGKLICPISAI